MASTKEKNPFRTDIGRHVFENKYALTNSQTWYEKSVSLVEDVCGKGYYGQYKHPIMSKEEREQLIKYIAEMKFLPGGRYIYYAGRKARFWNNCLLLKGEEDTREEWAALIERATASLMSGAGIGIDYSVFRPEGRILSRTGGEASGPIPLMSAINEIGRNVRQGGSRRSAIWAGLNWQHEDIPKYLHTKNWHDQPINGTGKTVADAKQDDFNYPAMLDMTNISVNYDDDWLAKENRHKDPIFLDNCRQALMTGEPGFGFNFGDKAHETLRNACTEVTSADDSDICNLGSLNLGNIDDIEEFKDVVRLASKFLVCGTIRAKVPYEKVDAVREKNRRLGLGLMGLHEWLLKRNYSYEVTPELHDWLAIYRDESERAANEHCDRFFLSRPVAYRAIAPTGSIGTMAGTTTGIEPLFAVAYKRRYLIDGDNWKYEYVVDATADNIIKETGCNPEDIETSTTLANNPEKRIKFQADVQDYVDMGISSTINLPAWGSEYNNEDKVEEFAEIVSKYAHRLRGLTTYPDGARGGQPITEVSYKEAVENQGVVFEENQNSQCKTGVRGI